MDKTKNGWPLTVTVTDGKEADAVALCIFHFIQLNQPLAAPHPPPLRCRIGLYVAVWDPASCSMSGQSGSIQVDGTFQPPCNTLVLCKLS